MLTIHKYPIDLEAGADQIVSMRQGAALLDVQLQSGAVAVWAHIDDTRPMVKRRIVIVGTGHDASSCYKDGLPGRYIATVQLRSGFLVLHFFDMGEVA
jgi:hypothetical protein